MEILKQTGKINICLVGMMGSGKSLIGKEISKIYKIKFYDTDEEIVKKEGKTINRIFLDEGEEYFRKIEKEVSIFHLKKRNCVVSIGGGGICSFNIREIIKENSYSIYLKVDMNILLKRLSNSKKRPLINKNDRFATLKEIYESRKRFYNKADLLVENNFDKKDVLDKIKLNIELK